MRLDFGEKGFFQLAGEAFAFLRNEGLINTCAHTWLILKRAAGFYVPVEDEQEYLPYESHYQENIDFSKYSTDVKALAFFLPQFHEIPENNEWWGKGFTEWVNTEKAVPRFKGHYQPRKPHKDIGYYDLGKIETLKKQVKLAKQHGIYGFCFYYYWFSGKRLLEKPIDMLLMNPEIDMPFCLCWANENWTRTWSGNHKDVLMAQEYSFEDRDKFIDDIKKYLDDKRYIRINGKPIIIVYNAGEIPDCNVTFDGWRKRAKEKGIGDILIWTCQTANHTAEELEIVDSIDAEVEFPPHNFWKYKEIVIKDLNLNGKSAFIYNYQKLVEVIREKISLNKKEKVPVYRTSMMGWDNASRRKTEWTTFYAFSLKAFYNWTVTIISEARKKFREDERYIFINAWNEWAEGTYLEPDEEYGYANINTFSKAIFDIPFEKRIVMSSTISKENQSELSEKIQIAVQCHVYYLDTIESIVNNISCIPYPFDCYITTDSDQKEKVLRGFFERRSGAQNVFVDIIPNRGRDVAPFLIQMKKYYKKYKYICHIHSKKTNTSEYGDFWREYLYRHLFGSKENLQAIFTLFEEDSNIGLIYPDTYPVLKNQAEWGGNKIGCKKLLQNLDIQANLNHEIEFPVGNMFWMRADAVKKILDYNWNLQEFQKEQGQVNLTLGHQIERLWNLAVADLGYRTQLIYNDIVKKEMGKISMNRLIIFVHFDKNNIIEKEDVEYLLKLKSISNEIVFVTNNDTIPQSQTEKLDGIVTSIIKRKNHGYDFGAWRDALEIIGYEQLENYDELVLVNNSCYSPIFPLEDIFYEMNKIECDLWGMTEFPEITDSKFLNGKSIKRHLQSYFLVFKKEILNSAYFEEYWKNVEDFDVMEEVVAHCENELTEYFQKCGFSIKAYIKESAMVCKYLNNYAVPFDYPYQEILLGNPLIKKKSQFTILAEEKNLANSIREELK